MIIVVFVIIKVLLEYNFWYVCKNVRVYVIYVLEFYI